MANTLSIRSQATAGFEADRWRLMTYNRATGTSTEITRNFDLQVEEGRAVTGRKLCLLHCQRARTSARIPGSPCGAEPKRC